MARLPQCLAVSPRGLGLPLLAALSLSAACRDPIPPRADGPTSPPRLGVAPLTGLWTQGWSDVGAVCPSPFPTAIRTSHPPHWRQFHAMATHSEGVLLFGGSTQCLQPLGAFLNDTWMWSGKRWVLRTQSTPVPSRRHMHMMAYDRTRDEVVLFGGLGNAAVTHNDTWVFRTTWERATRDQSSDGPSPRYDGVMAFDPSLQRVVLCGGVGHVNNPVTGGFTEIQLEDQWAWDGATRTWTQLPGACPRSGSGRHFTTMATHDGSSALVLFGGARGIGPCSTCDLEVKNDTWIRGGPADAAWELIDPGTVPGTVYTGDQPSRRYRHAMADYPVGNSVVLFGGNGNGDSEGVGAVLLGDTWAWGDGGWTLVDVPGPPARFGGVMAFDRRRGQVVLFGGEGAPPQLVSQLNDTWTWGQ